MKIINTCDSIKALFSNVFDMTVWRKYAVKVSKELPSKCEDDTKNMILIKMFCQLLKQY